MRALFLGVVFVSASALVLACSSDDGAPSQGTSSSSSSSSSTSSGGGDAGATKKKNAEGPCAANEECESNLCFIGGNQSFCSLPCTAANAPTVCVAPFTGSCNNRGACKRD